MNSAIVIIGRVLLAGMPMCQKSEVFVGITHVF